MNPRNSVLAVGLGALLLTCLPRAEAQTTGVYDSRKLIAERVRLESRVRELWQAMYDRLLNQQERAALAQTKLAFPSIMPDNTLLNFYADSGRATMFMPIHSLLLLEDACTAYAWLYHNGFSFITINEFAAMLKHRSPAGFEGGRYPAPLVALGIPNNALSDTRVNDLSLRFRNSAFAYALGHEAGHILHRHPGNSSVSPAESKAHELQADDFALRVMQRDNEIPMGAILFFQITAFTASPGRFDYSTEEEWRMAIKSATHPINSERLRGVASILRSGSVQYGANRVTAVEVSDKLMKISAEMDDRDWHLYYKQIGLSAPLSRLKPRTR